MKTRIFFTTLLLGIFVSAFCVTAKDLVSPYYPQHIYEDAQLDSVVEVYNWGSKIRILFDEKGRMKEQTMYELDEATNQWKYEGIYEYGYAEGFMFTSLRVQVLLENVDVVYVKEYKLEDLVYDASGNPISWTRYELNPETQTWNLASFKENQYDVHGNVVLERDSVMEDEESYVIRETVYEYEFDEKGRVTVQFQHNTDSKTGNSYNFQKTEYTYNSNGFLQSETEFYYDYSETFDDELGEYVKDSTWWEMSSVKQYVYNFLSNMEKIITYNGNGEEQSQMTYYYSFPSLHDIENLRTDSGKPVKLFHNGQVLILRGDKIYTISGQRL